jgi:hypothetical protein
MKNKKSAKNHHATDDTSYYNCEYGTRDVAQNFLPDMTWEGNHFGYCSMHCSGDHKCPAVFYFDGGLRVFCINKFCGAAERCLSLSASVFQKISDKWNQDKLSVV